MGQSRTNRYDRVDALNAISNLLAEQQTITMIETSNNVELKSTVITVPERITATYYIETPFSPDAAAAV